MSSGSRFTLARMITVAFVAAIVAGALGEIGVRVDDYRREGVPLLASPSFDDLIAHDTAGAHGTPYGRFHEFQLNSAGFRSSEAVLTPKPGCTRVIALGASETLGTGS